MLRPVEGGEFPLRYDHPFAEHRGASATAGLLDLSVLGKVECAGKDAREFLQRIVSADLRRCAPGSGTRSYLLDGKGKVQFAFQALATPDGFLLLTEAGFVPKLVAELEKLRFSEEVGYRDYTDALAALLVAGPRAEAIVAAAAGGSALPGPAEHAHAFVAIGAHRPLVVRDRRTGLEGFLLLVPAGAAAAVYAAIETAGRPHGLRRIGLAAFDSLRIEAGRPRFGLDYESDLFPQEIGDTSAFSLDKGCYPGQETVARIDTYGKTHRKLVTVALDSPNEDLPERGDKLRIGAEDAGEIRSWTISPSIERPLAFAVVRAAKASPEAALEIREGARTLTARIVPPPHPG